MMNDVSTFAYPLTLIISFVVFLAIFFIFRSVVLWYFNLNKIVEKQNRIEIVLKDILIELQKDNKKDSRYFDKE